VLIHEMEERRHSQCLAKGQSDAVQLTLDLLARDPDSVERFFELFTKTLVEECESLACDVWLTDEGGKHVGLWMTYQGDRLSTQTSRDWDAAMGPRESMGLHLFAHIPGWTRAVVYEGDDPRLPAPIRDLIRRGGVDIIHTAPLVLGGHNLGWIVLASGGVSECPEWRLATVAAVARQATFVLHVSRLAERRRVEERRPAPPRERNPPPRPTHHHPPPRVPPDPAPT